MYGNHSKIFVSEIYHSGMIQTLIVFSIKQSILAEKTLRRINGYSPNPQFQTFPPYGRPMKFAQNDVYIFKHNSMKFKHFTWLGEPPRQARPWPDQYKFDR